MKSTLPALIVGLAAVLAVAIAANAYSNRDRGSDAIRVTGLGKKDFASDLIVWSGRFSQQRASLQDAYAALEADRQKVAQYLSGKGVAEAEVTFGAVDINKQFDTYYDDRGNRHSSFLGYRLSQEVHIESNDVEGIEAIAREVTELINQGLEFNSYAPQYYYTGLSALKIEMIAAATEDARIRAEQIAENAGARLGPLQSGDMGIFQIIGQNSNEDYSWGGTFNTSSKMKTATITMKLRFGVR
jgi:hypothetical protein